MKAGVVHHIRHGVRGVLAPNANPFTLWGTWSYLLGQGEVTLVDPGPDIDAHLAALLGALEPGERITAILLTHSHRDHSGLTAKLKAATGAPVLAFGDSEAGLSPVMKRFRAGLSGGEGVDADFAPDQPVADGEVIDLPSGALRVLHTPGHMANHVAFVGDGFALTGDHVLSYASTYISPPHGDLTQFRASCQRLAALDVAEFLPGHGEVLRDPKARLGWLMAHRDRREAGVLASLARGRGTLDQVARGVYPDLPDAALPAARRNLLAHLVDLWQRDLISADPGPDISAIWEIR